MSRLKKGLALILTLCMMLSLMPVITPSSQAANGDDFYKIVHVDAGRKYFTTGWIKSLIDKMAEDGYTHLELAFGNDGLRFLLDDMSVTANDTTYTSDVVKAGIQAGNKAYYDFGTNELTEDEMDGIIEYAADAGIEIIPLLNTPGHMDAIITCMDKLGIDGDYNGSVRTVDVTNSTAVAFTQALVNKYIQYFAGKGCTVFNIGADEYANDIYESGGMGFGQLQSTRQYGSFVTYVNSLATMVKNAGMTPMAFNDGIYYGSTDSYGTFNSDIMISYWSSGWSSYNVASASYLANKGHKMINTHGDFYYVLGKSDNFDSGSNYASNWDNKVFPGTTFTEEQTGGMFCIWCDYPNAETEDEIYTKVVTNGVLSAMSEAMGHMPETPTEPGDATVADERTGVSVTAPGLTGVTVTEKASATDIDGAAEGKVVSYDIAPETSEGKYTGEATVSLPIPSGWDTSRIYGYVKNADNTILKDIAGTVENNKFTFTVPHFSEVGLYEAEGTTDIEVTENKKITVTVGQTTTAIISDANYEELVDKTELNESIATVEVTGTDAVEATTKYDPVSVTCNNLISSDQSNWTAASGYYYTPNGTDYYPVYAKRSSSWSWSSWSYTYTYTWGYSTTSSTSNVTPIGTQSTADTSTIPNITVYTQSKTEATPASTTVTFTGVAVGTTYVTVGNTRYTINVVAEDLSTVTPLTVEYWITNKKVTIDGATSGQIVATAAYAEDGVKITDLVPANDGAAEKKKIFWKAVCLPSGYYQEENSADMTGSTYAKQIGYIRYWNSAWAYSSDGQTWVTITDSDQIVAYYMQETQVTQEITTNVVDWGQDYAEWKAGKDNSWFWDGYVENGSKFVFLDFAVVYEDGTQNPSSFPVDNTWFFHFDKCSATNPRVLGSIVFNENDEFEIWKVTVQDGTCTGYSNASDFTPTYSGEETVVWDESMGGTPSIDSLSYTANRSGKLLRVYVRAKVTKDSLAVHYIDQTTNREFYDYNIAVGKGTIFDAGFALGTEKNTLENNSVTNIKGVTQTVTANLSEMPEIGAQYRYSDYTCVKVERSENGKDVYLYYTFSNTHNFVIDFGLPLKITTNDLSISGDWTSASVSGAQYGIATATVGEGVIYTPTQTLKGVETLRLTLTGSTDSVTHQIYIYPATTVYYEEGFATYNGDWGNSISKGSGFQTASPAGSKHNYGYDKKYADEVAGSSNGTQATSSAPDGTRNYATFTFTGTGVDVYANCTTQEAKLMIGVYQGTQTDSPLRVISVNTKMANGSEATTGGQAVSAYNVPVASITGLDYGEYTLKIIHVKVNNSTPGGAVKLDGFRVYGTLQKQDNDVYKADLEDNPSFIELRDEVLTAQNVSTVGSEYASQIAGQVYSTSGITEDGAIILSNGSENDLTSKQVQDLLDNGPKNEIYLQPGQALVFKVTTPRVVQIGLKALNAATTYTITGKTGDQTLNSSTDMFYTVLNKGTTGEQTITITNTGSGILSITKLKICDDPNATLGTLTAEDLIPALVSLGFETTSNGSGGSSGGGGGGSSTPAEPTEPTTPPTGTGLPFADVGPGDWFLDNVKYVYEKGLMNGTSDTAFSPQQTTNRAMIVTILHRLENSPAVDAQSPFADVAADQYYANPVAWAAANGIVTGTSETTFAPLNNITREQMAAILYRYAQFKGYDVSVGEDTNILSYADAETISEYAVPAIQWAVGSGLINGKGGGVLDPQGSATRAEVSAILARFCEAYAK